MYRIQGADQKEYGPISADQIRQWVAENRLNRFTLCAGEDGIWKPLGQFVEFADTLGPVPAAAGPALPSPPAGVGLGSYSPAGGMGREEALRRVKVPAILMIILGAISMLQSMASPFTTKAQLAAAMNQPGMDANTRQMLQGVAGMSTGVWVIFALVFVAYNGIVILGAVRMLKLRSFGLSMTAGILTLLPCTACCCLGLPLGIWVLMTLNRPDVKPYFQN